MQHYDFHYFISRTTPEDGDTYKHLERVLGENFRSSFRPINIVDNTKASRQQGNHMEEPGSLEPLSGDMAATNPGESEHLPMQIPAARDVVRSRLDYGNIRGGVIRMENNIL